MFFANISFNLIKKFQFTGLEKLAQDKNEIKTDAKTTKSTVKRKKKGMADWEKEEDDYDATEDMGGEFDLENALKKKPLIGNIGEKLDEKARQLKADLLGVEDVKGKAYFVQRS